MANGEWHGNRLAPDSADDLASALAAVADAAQETVTELLWQAWPLCAPSTAWACIRRDGDEQLSWWCAGERSSGGPAHIHAAVGALDAPVADSLRRQSAHTLVRSLWECGGLLRAWPSSSLAK